MEMTVKDLVAIMAQDVNYEQNYDHEMDVRADNEWFTVQMADTNRMTYFFERKVKSYQFKVVKGKIRLSAELKAEGE